MKVWHSKNNWTNFYKFTSKNPNSKQTAKNSEKYKNHPKAQEI